jgi:hypothetical protein
VDKLVFIVKESYNSGGCYQHGIFSDEKKAQELAKSISGHIDYKFENNHVFIEKYLLD